MNRNYSYISTVVDFFSEFAWTIPINKDTGKEISGAFNIIFKDRRPTKIHSDKGFDFINKTTKIFFLKSGMHLFTTVNETNAQVLERFNRTLKLKLYKCFMPDWHSELMR